MDIRPILSSLRRHRIPALLIVAEIALACAVLCNAVFMIGERLRDMHLPNGIDEQGLSVVDLSGFDPARIAAEMPRNLAALRGIAGVRGATLVNTVPLNHNSFGWGFSADPENRRVVGGTEYLVGLGDAEALGLQVLEGRLFRAGEYADGVENLLMPRAPVVVVTRSYAQRMWPGQPALGQRLYGQGRSYTVIGVVADVLAPEISSTGDGKYLVVFFPTKPTTLLGYYVLRSAPAERDRILSEAVAMLGRLDPKAVVTGRSFAKIRADYFANNRSMVWMLALVCAVMLAVTAFGIVGLTSFWVRQRRRQIGIRRAVGATRGQILGYFRTENFLLSTVGVALGMVLAFAINLYLMKHYELARMPWRYLVTGAVALWLLGQLAVWGPARRASEVPPVVATRSV